MEGWIKLHRKYLDWQWIDSYKHVVLFIHLLLRANHKKTKWRSVTISPGQILTGRKQLSKWTGLSEQSIRTVLSDLKSTSEITIKTYSKFSIISITNWSEYQQSNQQTNQQVTSNQPASNQQVTTSKNEKNEKNEKKKYISIVDHLNNATGKSFKHETKITRRAIDARLRDGFEVEDFFKVIDFKTQEWLNCPKMNQHLKPSTLFGNKFEGYLQATKTPASELMEELEEIQNEFKQGSSHYKFRIEQLIREASKDLL